MDHYGWPGPRGLQMGWRELMGWMEVMDRQLRGGQQQSDPSSFDDPVSEANFEKGHREIEKRRGR